MKNANVNTATLLETIGHAIAAATIAAANDVAKAQSSIIATLRAQAKKLTKPLEQGGDDIKAIRRAIVADMVASGCSDGHARVEASQQGKILLYLSHGFPLKAGNVKAAMLEMKEAGSQSFYTPQASSTAKGAKANKSAKGVDVKKLVQSLTGDELFAIMTDAQKIAAYKATCTQFGAVPSKKIPA